MPLAAMRLIGESNSATVPLSRTRTLAKEKKWSGIHLLRPGLTAQPSPGCCSSPAVTCQPSCFSQPTNAAATPHVHTCKAGYFSHSVCSPGRRGGFWDQTQGSYSSLLVGAPKTFTNEPLPWPGSQDCAQGATGLCTGPCAFPSALCQLTKAHGGKPGCSEA